MSDVSDVSQEPRPEWIKSSDGRHHAVLRRSGKTIVDLLVLDQGHGWRWEVSDYYGRHTFKSGFVSKERFGSRLREREPGKAFHIAKRRAYLAALQVP